MTIRHALGKDLV